MKQINTYFIQALALMIITACSNIDSPDSFTNGTDTKHVLKMQFIGNIIGFDQENQVNNSHQTKAANTTWNDGDKVYVTFYNNSTIVPGEATYSSSEGWSVSYNGSLAIGTNLKCEARFFVNATSQNSSLITLNANTEIYEDMSGKYHFDGENLSVNVNLSPKTGRIRFKGAPNTKIRTTGITTYSKFSPGTNKFQDSNTIIYSTVASNGFTPYIYGNFTNSDKNIGLVGDDYAFTRTCTNNILVTGESGYLSIPTENSSNNWRNGLYVNVSGIEFKMVPVVGYSNGYYLIAETETTEGLYNCVVSNEESCDSNYPKSSISYREITSFINKLNYLTGLSFSLPTADQWMYAAKGGNKSENYVYAGSNNPNDVAWYMDNCTSKQEVKTKVPNEIGIYDMSGNVQEITTTLAKSNLSTSYTCYGGCYSMNSQVLNTSLGMYTDSYSPAEYIGFRLILTF